MVATAPRDLDALLKRARLSQAEGPVADALMRLALLRDLAAHCDPKIVLWMVAYGSFLRVIDGYEPPARRRSDDMKIVVVTRIKTFFKATVLLGEEVFGPAFMKSNRFFDFDVWLVEDFVAASRKHSAEWKRLVEGISIVGSPERVLEHA